MRSRIDVLQVDSGSLRSRLQQIVEVENRMALVEELAQRILKSAQSFVGSRSDFITVDRPIEPIMPSE